jgi:hypothetical protein
MGFLPSPKPVVRSISHSARRSSGAANRHAQLERFIRLIARFFRPIKTLHPCHVSASTRDSDVPLVPKYKPHADCENGSGNSLKGTSKNCHRSSAAPNLLANDSGLFPFRFCAVHPKDAGDCKPQEFFEVPSTIFIGVPAIHAEEAKVTVKNTDEVPVEVYVTWKGTDKSGRGTVKPAF